MKAIQTGDQLELRSSGLGQFASGIVIIIIGMIVTFLLYGTAGDGGKKAPIWSVLIGIFFVVFGIIMIVFAKNRSVVMRKGADTTVSAKRIFGGSPKQQTVPTANIVAVRLSTYIEDSGATAGSGGVNAVGNQQNSRRSTLSLVLNNNDLIEVGASSGMMGGLNINGLNVTSLITKAPLSKEANMAATFLGVPLQADDTSSIAGAVRSLKDAFEGQGQPQPAPPVSPQIPQQQPQQTPPAPGDPSGPQTPPPPYTPPSTGAPQQ